MFSQPHNLSTMKSLKAFPQPCIVLMSMSFYKRIFILLNFRYHTFEEWCQQKNCYYENNYIWSLSRVWDDRRREVDPDESVLLDARVERIGRDLDGRNVFVLVAQDVADPKIFKNELVYLNWCLAWQSIPKLLTFWVKKNTEKLEINILSIL